jgi:hypothetical protein
VFALLNCSHALRALAKIFSPKAALILLVKTMNGNHAMNSWHIRCFPAAVGLTMK